MTETKAQYGFIVREEHKKDKSIRIRVDVKLFRKIGKVATSKNMSISNYTRVLVNRALRNVVI